MKRFACLFFATVFALSIANAQTKRPFTFDDMIAIKRVGDPQLSPDGRWIAFVVSVTDKAKNSRNSDLWLISAAGGEARQLTTFEGADNNPRWSPDGKQLSFVSSRDGSSQIWVIDIAGGEPRKVTSISTEASGQIWSPDGQWLAFVSDVYPDCKDDECNKKREERRAASKVRAHIADRLLYRHWTTWKDGKRSHLFIVRATGGEARDLTPGDWDVPPFSLGGPVDYNFSPDSKEICFARNIDPVEAISTNSDLWVVPISGGNARKITTNPGADLSPQYSPDGKFIAYRSQARAGYESDRWQLKLFVRATRTSRSLTENYDNNAGGFAWAPDSSRLFFASEEKARQPLFAVSVQGNDVKKILEGHTNDDVQVSRDGKTLIFTRQSMARPSEIYRANADGSAVEPVTHTNNAMLASLDLRDPEDVWIDGAGNTKLHSLLLKPPAFDPSKKYPFLLLIHGGPQGAWSDAVSYRWNAEVFSSAGYVVLMPNPHGSTGYGQAYTEQISGDWGGMVYEDLMKAADYAASLPFVDKDRMGAAGASYGGYMVNWIEGHTDRFKALFSHDGIFDTSSMYGSTEELWFVEWEFKGTPWSNRELYEKWSPSNFVKNFKTPMVVVQGELDFRVPTGEGLQLFTALQRMGVPSKLLYFPDEGHWVLKPQNSELWYATFIDWFDQYLKK